MDDRVRINVSGTTFETRLSTLTRFPRTLLGSHSKRQKHYNDTLQEFYFNRHRLAFESILFYYQSNGRLILPDEVPFRVFTEEVEFFELGEDALNSISQGMLPNTIRKEPDRVVMRKIWNLFEHPDTSMLARAIALFSVFMIIASVLVSSVETLPQWGIRDCGKSCRNQTSGDLLKDCNSTFEKYEKCSKTKEIFMFLETICYSWFLFEYVIRFATAPDRSKFVISPLNLVDLLAICPFFILLLIRSERVVSLAVLRIIRVLRVFRVLKLSRYSGGLRVLCYTLRSSLKELEMAMLFVCMIVVLSSSAVYYTDLGHPKSQFSSIPDAFWWCATTVTTVGYGDQIPVTASGRFVGCICAVLGVLAFSLPVMAFATNFNAYLKCEPVRKLDPARERTESINRYRKSFRVSQVRKSSG
ncbi:potassium voltage-gated channel subfamily A member 3 [Nematostella vectensis]